uniref:Uncharacterized protein n=1 Tax=Panagrolaimus davidi TaxID=227884 RepID=A0A914QYM6_9BILA
MEANEQINAAFNFQSVILLPKAFPSKVLKWMKQNAKPKMALKLMKVCKYFYYEDGFQYLVVKRLAYGDNKLAYSTLDDKRHEIDTLDSLPKKLWIVGWMAILSVQCTAASTLLLKTAICNIRKLQLTNQHITLYEFMLLTDGGTIESCGIIKTVIKNDKDEIVPLEDICECLPNAQRIDIGYEAPSIHSLKAAETKISSKLKQLELWISPVNNLGLLSLLSYMKKHQQIQYKLWIIGVPPDQYTKDFAPFVDKVVQEWSAEYAPPSIIVTPTTFVPCRKSSIEKIL